MAWGSQLHCRWRSGVLFGASIVAVALTAVAARAQDTDCNSLYASIQAAGNAGRDGGTWGRAAAQQRSEIERTQRYADQLGCGNGGGWFGDDPSPECGPVMDRLQRMQDNLASIQAQAEQRASADGGRRADLIARYNQACVGVGGGNPSDLSQRSDRGFLMPDSQNPDDPLNADGPSTVPPGGDIMDVPNSGGANRGQAICVRTCDGGYFPLSPRAHEDQLGALEQLCQASCPNTEAKLYTMARDGDLSSATAVDGAAYTALPAAFRFEKTFTPTCTCKPPNQSWSQALAGAEKLLGDTEAHDARDVTVTPEMSDEMAKPGAVPAPKTKPVKPSRATKTQKTASASADLSMARDAQKGEQAPTASNDTTGIGGPFQAARVVHAGDGPTVAVAGPDGVKKRVRLIVP